MSQWTADGPITAPAPKLVVTGFKVEVATALRLHMAVRGVRARRAKLATWGRVQVVLIVERK